MKNILKMKNVLGIIILLGGVLTGIAQNTKQYLDSIVCPRSKDIFFYDNKGNNILQISYHYRYKTWEKYRKSEYTYDDKGNKILGIGYKWEDATWEKYCKNEYTYDDKGNQTSEISYTLEDNTWVEWLKEEYIYDLSYSKIDLIAPSSYHSSNNMRTKEIIYSWDKIEWNNPADGAIYYWSKKTTP